MDNMDMTSGPIYCSCCCCNNNKEKIEYILISDNSKYNKNISFECPICLEDKPNTEMITTNCGHNYCIKCIKIYFISKKKPYDCAYCRTKIEKISILSNYYYMEFKIQDYLSENNSFDSNLVIRLKISFVLSVFITIIILGFIHVS